MALIEQTINGRVLELQLNRPEKKNALTQDMYLQLTDALSTADQDDTVHAVLLTGQSDYFTAGNDLMDFMANAQGNAILEDSPVIQFLMQVAQLNKPLILAINGAAVGIGTTLCLHSDLVICGNNTRFQLPFVKLGLVPEFASSFLLPRASSHSKAFELLILGEPFDAEKAYEVHLVNRVTDDDETLAVARTMAQSVAQLPIQAVIASKQLMKSHLKVQTLKAIEQEARQFAQRLSSEEAMQAFQAFFNR